VVSQRLPDGRLVGYGYDANGNLTIVTPPSRPTHGFTYTPVDLTASYDPPTVAEGATPTGYQYNLDRQLTRILRPDGIIIPAGNQIQCAPAHKLHLE